MNLTVDFLGKSSGRSLRARHGNFTRCAAVRAGSEKSIENLRTVYCDDFQCDSSPQVERTIRSFAKNVELHTKWTITIFAENAEYQVRFDLIRQYESKQTSDMALHVSPCCGKRLLVAWSWMCAYRNVIVVNATSSAWRASPLHMAPAVHPNWKRIKLSYL